VGSLIAVATSVFWKKLFRKISTQLKSKSRQASFSKVTEFQTSYFLKFVQYQYLCFGMKS